MGKLIDADAVMKIVDEELALRCGYDADIACFSIKKKIAELPTAYDVKKVVEELDSFSLNTIPYCNEMLREDLCDDSDGCDYCKLQYATEIVRKGGVNETT